MATQTKEAKTNEQECATNPIGWVEIPVNNMERAQTFFKNVFGFQFQNQDFMGFKMGMFPMSAEGKGSTGALMQGQGYTPSHDGSMPYFTAPDIQATEEKITRNGGKVLKPKFSIGEYGFVTIFEDTEGNRLALHSRS